MNQLTTNQRTYDFTIIMAVYNVEPFLREAVESVVNQDYPFHKIQLILVDDGSRDQSKEICDEYEKKYPDNVIAIHQENKGVSCARNAAFPHARGKYVNTLDADDRLSTSTLSEVWKFFEEHEADTDVVSIPIIYFEGRTGEHPLNDKFQRGSRVINLREEWDAAQLSMSSAFIKLECLTELSYDERLHYGEDAKLLTQILLMKQTLGVVSTAKYEYRVRTRGNQSALQQGETNPNQYLPKLRYYTIEMIAHCKEKYGNVPKFVQFSLLYDLQWVIQREKLPAGVMTPTEEGEYLTGFYDALRVFDNDVILAQRMLSPELKFFLLQKKDPDQIKERNGENDVGLYANELRIFSVSEQPLVVEFIDVASDGIRIIGSSKMFELEWKENTYEIFLKVNGEIIQAECKRRKTNPPACFGEVYGWTLAFEGFVPRHWDENRSDKVTVFLKVGNITIPKFKLLFGEFAPISNYSASYYSKEEMLLKPAEDGILVYSAGPRGQVKREAKFLLDLWRANKEGTRKAVVVRVLYRILKAGKRKPIWLISDRILQAGDNGEAFFRYLSSKESRDRDIDVYYLLDQKSKDYTRMKQFGKVIPISSMKHKLLYLLSDYNLSSQADHLTAMPFHGHNEGYRDLLAEKRFVFLQHGVTKDDLSEWLAKDKMNIYGFVTVSEAEAQSVLELPYGYTEQNVWLTGFPRFDLLPGQVRNKRQITVVPTWRNYLMGAAKMDTGERRIGRDFEDSLFFRYYSSLLNNDALLEAAKQYHYQIAFYPHPNLQNYVKLFRKNDQVLFLGNETSYSEIYRDSSLLVTDYSSVVFDFAYMGKPVIYTQFDKNDFFSGNHTYKKGYFDYEKDGFGEVEYTLDGTVERIIEYMKSECQMKEQYRERVDRFFAFHDKMNCQRLYEKLCEHLMDKTKREIG